MFTGSFTLTKTPNLGLNYCYVTDNSDYADEPKVDFSDRYFYLIRPDGTYVQSPEGTDKWEFDFATYPTDIREIELIDEDMALNIKMYWIPDTVEPDSTYELSTAFDFLDNTNLWGFNLVVSMSSNYSLTANKNFLEGIFAIDTLISASNLSISEQDAYSSQQCINGINYFINNPNVLY